MTDPTHFAIVSSDGEYFNLAITAAVPEIQPDPDAPGGELIVGWLAASAIDVDPVRLEVPAGPLSIAGRDAMAAADFRIEWEDTYRPVEDWRLGGDGAGYRPLVRK